MNIGIDGNEANVENRVGVNTYAYNLLVELNKISKKSDKNKFVIFLKNKPYSFLPEENKNWNYKILPAKRKWILTQLRPYLKANLHKIDVFFTPSHYTPPFLGIPRVFSVMDLGYLENKGQFKRTDFYQLKLWTAYSMRIAKRIISISAQTERDIVRHDKNLSMKTFITHLGYDSNVFNKNKDKAKISDVKNKYSIVNDYILFISTLKPSKNIEGLLEAWSKVEKEFPKTDLVIAGKKGWLFETIFEKVKSLNIENRVVFTDFVHEEDKEHLIKGAQAFILPSYWEGFGLDVLSSLASGVPTIISKVGSLPEVGGDAAIYVDPYKIDTISNSIKKVLSLSEKEYNVVVEKGLKQAEKFSWQKTAVQTLEIIENSI